MNLKSLFLFATLLPILQTYNLVWSDEFDTPQLDTTKWDYEINCWGGGNNEKQCYVNSPTTLYIQDGCAIIKPVYYPNGYKGSKDGCTDDTDGSCTWVQPVTSARIRTLYSQSWRYGKFEFRAKLPIGNFLWPALWLLPAKNVYGNWAASGEIDIVEFRGQASQHNFIENTVHHGGVWPYNIYTGSGPIDVLYNLTEDFHIFTLLWTHESVQWFVDDEKTFELSLNKSWWSGRGENPYTGPYQPFDQEFYIVMNLAIAGNFFNPSYGQFNPAEDYKTWSSPFQIDYVRVYQNETLPVPVHQETPRDSWHAPLIIMIAIFFAILLIATVIWRLKRSTEYSIIY